MDNNELRKLVIDTGLMLHLESNQIGKLYLAINLAYTSGWLDRAKMDKSDIEIALENGASLDDLPVK